jgi:hypothetical protein
MVVNAPAVVVAGVSGKPISFAAVGGSITRGGGDQASHILLVESVADNGCKYC